MYTSTMQESNQRNPFSVIYMLELNVCKLCPNVQVEIDILSQRIYKVVSMFVPCTFHLVDLEFQAWLQ